MRASFRSRLSFAKIKFHEITGVQIPKILDASLWLAGVLIMLGLTINDLVPMIGEYYDDDANVAVQIKVNRNGTLIPPPLYLCVPVGSEEAFQNAVDFAYNHARGGGTLPNLPCQSCMETLMNRTHDLWSGLNFTVDRQTLTDNMLLKLSNIVFDKNAGNSLEEYSNIEWIDPVINAAWKILSCQAARDHKVLFHDQFSDQSDCSHKDKIGSLGLETGFERLVSFAFCHMSFSGIDSDLDYMKNTSIFGEASGGDNPLCLELPTYIEDLYVHVEDIFSKFNKRRGKFQLYSENPVYNPNSVIYESPPLSKEQDALAEIVDVKYSMQALVKEERESKNCYKQKSKTDCTVDCKTEKIMDFCHCIPFSARFSASATNNTRNLSYCNQTHFEKCNGKFSSEDCSKICDTACEYATYVWQITSTMADEYDYRLDLYARPFVLPYLIFSSSIRDSRGKFISSIGGSFNFYLGLSGLSLMFFFSYFLKSIKRWVTFTRRNNDATRLPRVLFWQWLWIKHVSDKATAADADDKKADASNNERIRDLEEKVDELMKLVKATRMCNCDSDSKTVVQMDDAIETKL